MLDPLRKGYTSTLEATEGDYYARVGYERSSDYQPKHVYAFKKTSEQQGIQISRYNDGKFKTDHLTVELYKFETGFGIGVGEWNIYKSTKIAIPHLKKEPSSYNRIVQFAISIYEKAEKPEWILPTLKEFK